MSEEEKKVDWSNWFSTYGFLTAERVLDTFHIHLANDELISAVKNPRSMYYQLLRIPLKNIFNGIILQQARDYQVYAQKIFIDYLLSGENDKEAGSPGANTREDLENERVHLVEMGENFDKQEQAHQKLIAESQATLINLAAELEKSLAEVSKKTNQILKAKQIVKTEQLLKQAIRRALIDCNQEGDEILAVSSPFWSSMAILLDIELNNELRGQLSEILSQFTSHRAIVTQSLTAYLEQTEDMSVTLRDYRSQFYQAILRATEWIKLLPDYHPDEARTAENLSALDFDAKIGE